jgi:hypothetical protein
LTAANGFVAHPNIYTVGVLKSRLVWYLGSKWVDKSDVYSQSNVFYNLQDLNNVDVKPRGGFHKSWVLGVKGKAHPNLGENA